MNFRSAEIKFWRVFVLFVLVSATVIGGVRLYEYATRPNYYRLDYRMSMEQVVSIMGDPGVKFGEDKDSIWTYSFPRDRERSSLTLEFRDGRLIGTGEKWTPWR